MAFWGYESRWRQYVPVEQRRRSARCALPGLLKNGETASPVQISGRKIATSFWGAAWCEQLEDRADYSNRLPRGRTYVRNGSVVHLSVARGSVTAYVQGSDLYTVKVTVAPLPRKTWEALITRCAGQVASVVELLQGKLPKAALDAIGDPASKLFPSPSEIKFTCSCPDWASMCKHVAAVLYGIGARLDHQPELFFQLRGVDWNELVTAGVAAGELSRGVAPAETLVGSDLSHLFGIELEAAAPQPAARPVKKKREPKKPATITSSELKARGIPSSTAQSWVRSGVLLRTDRPGLYQTTDQTEARIAAYRSRRAASTG